MDDLLPLLEDLLENDADPMFSAKANDKANDMANDMEFIGADLGCFPEYHTPLRMAAESHIEKVTKP